jgi:exonuclease III
MFIMTMHNIFIWNVRGLNSRARRDVVREFILQQHVSVVCLVETKLDVIRSSVACDLMGSSFDYVFLPSVGVAGGILIGWRRDLWSVQRQTMRRFSVTVDIQSLVSAQPTWSLATVYRPVDDELKAEFLEELREIHADCPTPLLLCGDFNLIYQAADKSNDRLNIRSMRRFRRVIDDLQLEELYLHGRLYTWSNERRHPTLERIDRAFGSLLWMQQFTDHHMRSLSTDSSDHAPLLLRLDTQLRPKPCFRFECFWPKMDGFLDVVQQAWSCNLDNIDACRTVDFKLRRTAKALKSWSMRKIGSVRLELFMV